MAQWFENMFNSGPLPNLERSVLYSSARHDLILENIANADTPHYRRKDLNRARFQEALRSATSRRATEVATEKVRKPQGVLRHDDNNVDMEKELALMARNASYHNRMLALLKKHFSQLRFAIAGRPPAT